MDATFIASSIAFTLLFGAGNAFLRATKSWTRTRYVLLVILSTLPLLINMLSGSERRGDLILLGVVAWLSIVVGMIAPVFQKVLSDTVPEDTQLRWDLRRKRK